MSRRTTASRKINCMFFFSWYGAHRDLHSFPTRRSSDLVSPSPKAGCVSRSAFSVAPRSAQMRGNRENNREFSLLRSEEHTSELQSRGHLVCRLLLEKKKIATSSDGLRSNLGQQHPRNNI